MLHFEPVLASTNVLSSLKTSILGYAPFEPTNATITKTVTAMTGNKTISHHQANNDVNNDSIMMKAENALDECLDVSQ